MNSNSNKLIPIAVIVILVALGIYAYTNMNKSNMANDVEITTPYTNSTSTQQTSTTTQPAIIDKVTGKYTSPALRLSFMYPQTWTVTSDNLANGGNLQIFDKLPDSPEATANGYVNSKIEMRVVNNNQVATSSDYTETKRVVTNVVINGKNVTKYDIEYGTTKTTIYMAPISSMPGKFLSASFYGDYSKVSKLTSLVNSILQ